MVLKGLFGQAVGPSRGRGVRLSAEELKRRRQEAFRRYSERLGPEGREKRRRANSKTMKRLYKADPEKFRKRHQDWYNANREKVGEAQRQWRARNLEKCKERDRRYYAANPERGRSCRRRNRARAKVELFRLLGDACACCGEDYQPFLAIDHVNGDGAEHRRANKGSTDLIFLLRHFKAGTLGYDIQLLCHNCNIIKGTKPRPCPCPYAKAKNGGRGRNEPLRPVISVG